MSSTNPTLINGFEDVMAHIKKLEEENKKLKEENEKLKCEDDTLEDTLASLNFYTEQCAELKEENKKLEDKVNMYDDWVKDQKISRETLERENKKLKEEAEIREDWIHNVIRCLEVYDEWEGAGGDETADDLADRVASENKKLKEEIFLTKMQLAAANENADVAVHNEAAGIILAENDELKEENKKIMEERIEAKRQFTREREMMQDSLDKAYASIESDVTVFEFIDHIGGISADKEQIDDYTEDQLSRETLYSLADITLPEEDEE
jgi:hypothetical protein